MQNNLKGKKKLNNYITIMKLYHGIIVLGLILLQNVIVKMSNIYCYSYSIFEMFLLSFSLAVVIQLFSLIVKKIVFVVILFPLIYVFLFFAILFLTGIETGEHFIAINYIANGVPNFFCGILLSYGNNEMGYLVLILIFNQMFVLWVAYQISRWVDLIAFSGRK